MQHTPSWTVRPVSAAGLRDVYSEPQRHEMASDMGFVSSAASWEDRRRQICPELPKRALPSLSAPCPPHTVFKILCIFMFFL